MQTEGGGTDFRNVIDTIMSNIYIRKLLGGSRKRQSVQTNKAVFLITDAEQTVVKDNVATTRQTIKSKADNLKRGKTFLKVTISVTCT